MNSIVINQSAGFPVFRGGGGRGVYSQHQSASLMRIADINDV